MSYTTNQYTRKILYLVRVFGFTGTYLHGNGVNVFSKCNMSVLAHTKVFLHNVRIRCCTHKRAKHEMLYQVYSCRRLTPTNVPDIIFSACIDLWYKTQGGRVSGGKKKRSFRQFSDYSSRGARIRKWPFLRSPVGRTAVAVNLS